MEGKCETKFSPDPSSEFSFALELERGNAASNVDSVPHSSGSATILIYFQYIEVKYNSYC